MNKRAVIIISVAVACFLFFIKNIYGAENYKLVIQYLDEYSREKISEDVVSYIPAGSTYKANEKNIKDYKIFSSIGNVEKSMPNQDLSIVYTYKYNNCKITAKYYNDSTNECIAEETKVGMEGDMANFEEKSFKGLMLTSKPVREQFIFNKKDNIVYFHYKNSGKINVKYIDKYSSKILKEKVFEGEIGKQADFFNRDAIKDYVFEYTDTNYEFKEKEQNVNVYVIHQGKVRTEYIDKESNFVFEIFEQMANEGTEVEISERNIPGYNLIEKPEKEKFIMGNTDINKVYYYERKKPDFIITANATKLSINNYYHNLHNGTSQKIELTSDELLNSQGAKIEYNIEIYNLGENGEICRMECEIPKGYKALAEDNPEFNMFNDETFVTKDSIYIANGEKVNYKLIITKIDNTEPSQTISLPLNVISNSKDLNMNNNSTVVDLVMVPITGKTNLLKNILLEILMMTFLMYVIYSVKKRLNIHQTKK